MKQFLQKFSKVLKSIIKFSSNFLLFLLLFTLTAGVLGGGYLVYSLYPTLQEAKSISYDKLLSINNNTFRCLDDTVIYDNNGDVITEINVGNYEYVTIDKVSKWVTEGYIAVEDRNFKVHNGIDYKAIVRAVLNIVKNKGKITQGGSTITQQVIKNNLLTKEKSFKRKFIEFYLAPQVEKQYSKSQIMEFYVNTNSYGNNCEGIGTAAKYYFGKEVKDLNIEEAALLIGISNNPTAYNPKSRPEVAKEKRDFVLSVMYGQGVINEKQYEEAKSKEIKLVFERELREPENYQVSFAIHSATLKIMELEGFEFKFIYKDKEDYDVYKENYRKTYNDVVERVRSGGYKIYTSLDTEKQILLQNIVDEQLKSFKEKEEDGRYSMQGAATLINNETGYVEAIVGGRGTEDEFNRAFLGVRQPGSAIKPIVVYGVAYDTGAYYPSLKLEDKYIENGPNNWDGIYRGNVSLREALCRSINTVAFDLFTRVGAEKGLEYLSKLRFGGLTYMDNGNNAISLGGFTYGATTLDMAKAYSTLGNYGEYRDNLCITQIEFQNEGVIFDGEINTTKVYEPDAAYMVVDSLHSNMTKSFGLGRKLNVKNAIVGGKSGTTNSQKDAWFCGLSPYYTLSVWVGYDNPKPTGIYGSGVPGKIWGKTMTALHKDLEMREFERPVTITEKYINWKGEYVDYNSGVKDLYSQILVEKSREELLAKLEKERIIKERKLTEGIKEKLETFRTYKIEDITAIEYVRNMEKSILKEISELETLTTRLELENELDIIVSSFQSDLQPFREQLLQEELERERKYQLGLESYVEERLSVLSSIVIKDYDDINKVTSIEDDINKVLKNISEVPHRMEYADELKSIMERLNAEKNEFYLKVETIEIGD